MPKRHLETTLVALSIGLQGILALGLLPGNLPLLILVIAGTLYLPGWLLLSRLPLIVPGHPVARFGWVLAVGVAAHVLLGVVFKQLRIPVGYYLLFINLGALLLVYRPQRLQPTDDELALGLPGWGLLALSVGVALYNGIMLSQHRFDLYEDASFFALLTNQLAFPPSEVGREVFTPPYSWVYTYAAWVWLTEIPAFQLLWYWVTPLFLWCVPLLIFGLAYTLHPDAPTATYAAAASVLAGLLLLDPFVYHPGFAYGQETFAQLSTLRYFSTAIVLPLAQMTAIAYLKRPGWAGLAVAAALTLALGLLHPRQSTLQAITIGAFGLAYVAHQRRGLRPYLVICGLLLVGLFPAVQERLNYPLLIELYANTAMTVAAAAPPEVPPLQTGPETSPANMVRVFGAGGFVLDPIHLLQAPLLFISVALSLGYGLWSWRTRRLDMLFAGATTAAVLFLLFTPGLTRWVAFAVSLRQLPTLLVGVPVSLVLGITWAGLVQSAPRWVGASLVALTLMLGAFEPFDVIPGSGRDQQRAFIASQAPRDILPADHLLLAEIDTLSKMGLYPQDRYLAPLRINGYIAEAYPQHQLVRWDLPEEATFRKIYRQPTPFVSSDAFHMIVRHGLDPLLLPVALPKADTLLNDPRFALIDTFAGYHAFDVLDLNPDAVSDLQDQINAVTLRYGRYDSQHGGFNLSEAPVPSGALPSPISLPPREAAVVHTLIGQLEQAAPLWATLPGPNAADAHARVLLAQGEAEAAFSIWQGLLDDGYVFIADRLLTLHTAYLLPDDLIEAAIATTRQYPDLWTLHMQDPVINRERAAVLISREYYAFAAEQLTAIPLRFVTPADIWTLAALYIQLGDVERARATVARFLRSDIRRIPAHQHPDRWQDPRLDVLASNLESPEVFAGMLQPVFLDTIGQTDAIRVELRYGQPTYVGCRAQFLQLQLTSQADATLIAEMMLPISDAWTPPESYEWVVPLPASITPFTAGQVVAQARCNDFVAYPIESAWVMLRPTDTPPPDDATFHTATFGDSIRFRAYQIQPTTDMLTVTLYWQALQRPEQDYQVMLHLLDAEGNIIAQADGTPLNGQYPTSQWLPGNHIPDTRSLAISSLASAEALRIGFYRLEDGKRLPVTDGDDVAGDHLLIPLDLQE